MTQNPLPAALMRGGTSKGLVLDGRDLPTDRALRDAVLLAVMGSPDPRQIDGVGGAHPLTSKIAVVTPSGRDDSDVDYLFLQVWPDRAEVADTQNCGNMLAAVAPFALDRGLVAARDGTTTVRIWLVNTSSRCRATVRTPGGVVDYDGTARIDGVPGTAAPLPLEFLDAAGSSCGALLPTGRARDEIAGFQVTCVDNGMPVVCLRAGDLGVSGRERPDELEADDGLRERVEAVRLAAGPLMNLGDVTRSSVPKLALLSPPTAGGVVSTRTFIPHRVHDAIGVLGAVSVATACLVPGSVAADVAVVPAGPGPLDVSVEHPSGEFTVTLDVATGPDGSVDVRQAALLRTARLLMRGEVLVPAAVGAGR